MGVFDEGCMGMYNAIIDDELLNPMGSVQGATEPVGAGGKNAHRRRQTKRNAVRQWLDGKGVRFRTGKDEETELTDAQILEQCKMYIAAVRIADDFGCDAIGIQYQQGLKDMVPASDLAEGLFNNSDRPPVFARRKPTRSSMPAGRCRISMKWTNAPELDALVTNRCWTALGLDPATTLHDVRWGEQFQGDGIDDFVWVLQISGAAPRVILSADMRAHPVSVSLPCIFRSAAAP